MATRTRPDDAATTIAPPPDDAAAPPWLAFSEPVIGEEEIEAVVRCLRFAVVGLRVRDSQGTILVERELARRVRPHLEAGGFFFSTELIALATRMGARPVELPVDYRQFREGSTVRPVQDGLAMARALFSLRPRLRTVQ